MTTQIQLKRATAGTWTSEDPILAAGEQGLETDTNRRKTGDGSTTWTSLSYDDGHERMFVPARLFEPYIGSPTFAALSTTHRQPMWLLDSSAASENIIATCDPLPDHWNTFDVYAYWYENSTTATNDIYVTIALQEWSIASPTVGTSVFLTTAAHTTNGNSQALTRQTVTTGETWNPTHPKLWQAVVLRDSDDVLDTYAADIGFVALEFVRAT